VGTSTWSFPGWRGIVWDGPVEKARLARDGLAAYAEHPLLTLAGVDRTWYGPVPGATYARWANDVPGEFRFIVKAARLVTDPRGADGGPNPLYLDPRWALDHVLAPAAEGLGQKLGALVLQFSPARAGALGSPAAFSDRLHDFLRGLPSEVPLAVEVRNPELIGPEYAASLADTGTAHCYAVHPSIPTPAEQGRLMGDQGAGPLVVRWMLRRNRRYEEAKARYAPFGRLAEPDPSMRDEIADLVLAAAGSGRPALVSINNKAEGSAPLSAFCLSEAVAARYAPASSDASHSSSEPSLMSSNRNVER
jgi:uncharacterized protein YecE (DUF72 family)